MRPVSLIPKGRIGVKDLAFLSDVTCKGLATQCKAGVKLDGILSKLPKERQRFKTTVRVVGKGKKRRRVVTRVKVPLTQPKLVVKLRSPQGRLTRKSLQAQRPAQRPPPAQGPGGAGAGAQAVVARQPAAVLGLGQPGLQGPHRAGRPQEDRPALGQGRARRAAAEQPPDQHPRRLDPRGHAGPRSGADRLRHGHDRPRAQGGGRQHHARPLPDERGPAGALRQGRDHGLEPGADLAARPRRQPAPVRQRAQARDGADGAHRDRARATTRR